MIMLTKMHPIQLVLGSILVIEELAAKNRQLSLTVLCEQAAEWAADTRDLLREIAADAGTGRLEVRELLGDGHASATDIQQLDARFAGIETQAREGRIL